MLPHFLRQYLPLKKTSLYKWKCLLALLKKSIKIVKYQKKQKTVKSLSILTYHYVGSFYVRGEAPRSPFTVAEIVIVKIVL